LLPLIVIICTAGRIQHIPDFPQTLQKKSLFAKPDLKKTVSGGILINRQFVL
jgi:hypothetical protein